MSSAAGAATAGRDRRFRQAAFFYLHVGILYECVVFVLWREDLLPPGRGGAPVWLLIGAAITGVIFWGLYSRRSVWLARIVWALHALRLPAIVRGAFFAVDGVIPPDLWRVALPIVLVNLWLLARAGWDL